MTAKCLYVRLFINNWVLSGKIVSYYFMNIQLVILYEQKHGDDYYFSNNDQEKLKDSFTKLIPIKIKSFIFADKI